MINIGRGQLLAPFTTFEIGGPAAFFAEVFDEKGLFQAAEFAKKKGKPVFILGGGSNLLVSDLGFDGMVILNRIKGIEIDRVTGQAGVCSGEVWDSFVDKTVEADIAGIECLSGIPGTVGGAVVQNVSAYGQSISTTIESVRYLDLETFKLEERPASECEFAYHSGSMFKQNPGKYAVLKVQLKLAPSGSPTVAYADVAEHLKRFRIKPNLFEVREAVKRIRASKGHLIDPEFESFRSSGSFFKNPVIDQPHFEEIREELSKGSTNDNWHWPTSDGRIKVAAARLIEASGFHRGYEEGKVGLSPRHVLVLINLGGGTGEAISNLALKIAEEVEKRFNIRLKEEVQRLGDFRLIDQTIINK